MAERIYKLIVVDDEAIIREGVSRKISWGDNGFELSGTFEHGLAALEFMEENKVDVVISDINMPRMDGLTLSKELSEKYPDVMVLLLTGYDDFEYAQEAVKNQVREFLLKPITAKELNEVLSTVKLELDASRNKVLEQEEMKEKLEESFPLLKERFFNRLVSARITGEQLGKRSRYIGWNNSGEFYQILAIHIPASWNEIYTLSLSEYLKNEIIAEDVIFTDRDENMILILQDETTGKIESRSQKIAEKAFNKASEFEKEQIIAARGEIVKDPEQLTSSYKGALNALEYSRVMCGAQIISAGELRNRDQITLEEFNNLTRDLISRLSDGNREETKKSLEVIINYLQEHYQTREELPFYFTRLHYLLFYFVQEMDLNTSEESFLPGSGEKFGSFTEARKFFISMLDAIEDRIQSRRNDMVISRIDKAKKIITEKYGDSAFSLQDICSQLYLSVSQFSLIFKEGTGQTFIEYLTSFRVEAAKILLKTTDMKGYQVAEAVGYTDPRYFTLIFKKQTGMTAMEYRKSLEQ